MTIHADWIHTMKALCPEGFTPTLPISAEAGFIDGQIKLMAMPGGGTWEHFIRSQFVCPVAKHWELGAARVILAFDDYANVPRAKQITQATRRSRTVPIQFEPDDPMPDTPPLPWDGAMANRAFKAKVQQLVVEALPRTLEGAAGRSLTIDLAGPECWTWTWHEDGTVTKTSEPREQVRVLGCLEMLIML